MDNYLLSNIKTNKRDYLKFPLELEAKMLFKNLSREIKNEFNVLIKSISYENIKINLRNTEFVYNLINYQKTEDQFELLITFNFEDKEYSFINQIYCYNIALTPDREFEVTIETLVNKSNNIDNDNLLEILVTLCLRSIFIGYISKEIEAEKFENDILDKITDETEKKFVLSLYQKDYEKSIYKLKESTDYEKRELLKKILESIDI